MMAAFSSSSAFGQQAPRRTSQQDRIAQQLAEQLLHQGSSTGPVQSPLEGISRALQGVVGGYVAKQGQDRRDKREGSYNATLARALAANTGKPAESVGGIDWQAQPGSRELMTQILGGNPDTAGLGLQLQLGQQDQDRSRQQGREDYLFEQQNQAPKPPVPGRDIPFPSAVSDQRISERLAGRDETNVNVGSNEFGTIPPGWMIKRGPGGAQMVPVPGGPADVKSREAEETAVKNIETTAKSQAAEANSVLTAIAGIRKEVAGANAPVFGTNSIPFSLHSSTAAGRARSHIGSLKSPIVLNAMKRLKDASSTGATGFGALNTAELQVLMDSLGKLEPNTTDQDIIMNTIDRIEGMYGNVIKDIRRNVTPERIKELGLEDLIAGTIPPDGEVQEYDYDPATKQLIPRAQ